MVCAMKYFLFMAAVTFYMQIQTDSRSYIFQRHNVNYIPNKPKLNVLPQCPGVSHETTYMQYMQDIYFRIPLTQGSPKLCSVKSWDVTPHFIKLKKTDFEVHFY
jgi:hypothetical protein